MELRGLVTRLRRGYVVAGIKGKARRGDRASGHATEFQIRV
jgi:hypothetical protein